MTMFHKFLFTKVWRDCGAREFSYTTGGSMDWKKNFEKLFATLYKPKILLLDLNRNVHICAPKHTKCS